MTDREKLKPIAQTIFNHVQMQALNIAQLDIETLQSIERIYNENTVYMTVMDLKLLKHTIALIRIVIDEKLNATNTTAR